MGRFNEILILLYRYGQLTNKEIRRRTDYFATQQDLSWKLIQCRSAGYVKGPVLGKWTLTQSGMVEAQKLVSKD